MCHKNKNVTCYILSPMHRESQLYDRRAYNPEKSASFLGVSHLLHTRWLRHLRALLSKRGNVEG